MSDPLSQEQQVDVSIVSAEQKIFDGSVQMVIVTGQMGDLGLAYGHSPLLTSIKPGHIRVVKGPDNVEIFYVSGGMLEVQPSTITILADSVLRADDIDEAAAREAKERAKHALADKNKDMDYTATMIELAKASAQLRAISELRNLRK